MMRQMGKLAIFAVFGLAPMAGGSNAIRADFYQQTYDLQSLYLTEGSTTTGQGFVGATRTFQNTTLFTRDLVYESFFGQSFGATILQVNIADILQKSADGLWLDKAELEFFVATSNSTFAHVEATSWNASGGVIGAPYPSGLPVAWAPESPPVGYSPSIVTGIMGAPAGVIIDVKDLLTARAAESQVWFGLVLTMGTDSLQHKTPFSHPEWGLRLHVTMVPEPSSIALLGIAGPGLGLLWRSRRRRFGWEARANA